MHKSSKNMAAKGKKFDLETQLVFYASYHNDWGNIIIHLLCIWPILATAICLMQFTPALLSTPEFVSTSVPFGHLVTVNAALLVTLFLAVRYPSMEPVVGAMASLMVVAIYLISSRLVMENQPMFGYPLWQTCLFVHVSCWLLQFVGHGVFEGRAPALTESLVQALQTAPLFILMEVFFAFGYRHELYRRVMRQVGENIQQFKKEKAK